MKIGITGATGQMGRIVVALLKERGLTAEIVALVRNTQKASDLGVEARVFDYDKPDTLAASLKGIDKLLLISGSEIGKRLEQHTHVINASKNAGVKHIVYTSLLHADRSTISLAPEHLGTEEALKKSGISYTLLRNGWYAENYNGMVSQGIATGTIVGSSGNGRISAASRADYAAAAVAVLSGEGHEGKVYELAADEFFTMSDYAAVLSGVSGKAVAFNNLTAEAYASILVESGMPEMYAQFYATTDVSIQKGDLFDDGRQLSKLIGRPTTSLTMVIKAALK